MRLGKNFSSRNHHYHFVYLKKLTNLYIKLLRMILIAVLVFYCCYTHYTNLTPLSNTNLFSHSSVQVRSLYWLSWFLCFGCHKAEIIVLRWALWRGPVEEFSP